MRQAIIDIIRLLPVLPAIIALSVEGVEGRERDDDSHGSARQRGVRSTVLLPAGDQVPVANENAGRLRFGTSIGLTTNEIDLAREIRRAIVDDDSLSVYAHNVRIITRNREIILRGPVRSAREKARVEQRATAVAGVDKVTNELEVMPEQADR